MTPAVIGLLILAFCIVLWVTEWIPAVATGALGCLLFVLLGVCELEEAFSGFASSIVYLLFGAMVVGDAMFETGAAQLIGRQVIKISRNNERIFLLVSGVVAAVLSMFLANNAVIAAFLPIIDSVCSISDKMNRKNLVLNVAICAMLGGACTLVGCTPQLTANAMLQEMTGLSFSMFTMFAPGVLITIVYLVATQLFGYKMGKRIWGDRPDEALKLDEGMKDDVLTKQYDKKKVITISVILVLMIVFYVTEWLPTAMTAMCAAMLCVLTKCTSVKSIQKNMDWNTVLFLAFCLGMANALTAGGSGELIADAVSKVLGDHPSAFVVYAVLCLLSLVISQFITNSTAIIIVLPIAFSICSAMGFNPMAFCLGVYFAASLACSTPLAAAQITMTLVAGYKFSDYIRYTWLHDILFYAGILIFVPMFFPLVL